MIDTYYRIYIVIERIIDKLKLNKVPKLKGLMVKTLLFIFNILITAQYSITRFKTKHTYNNNLIVSLTSFPDRINRLNITIESLLRQKFDGFSVYLWLSKKQFPGLEKDLPKKLLRLMKSGLHIEFVDGDLKPHKKYYYAMENLFPEKVIVTFDDDIIYPTKLLSKLYRSYVKHGDVVVCSMGRLVKYDEQIIKPYSEWYSNSEILEEPLLNLCPIGAGGVLYPPNILHKDVFNIDLIKKTCLSGDDLWLFTMRILNSKNAIKISDGPNLFIGVLGSQKVALHKNNVNKKENDIQLNNIIKYYDLVGILNKSDLNKV